MGQAIRRESGGSIIGGTLIVCALLGIVLLLHDARPTAALDVHLLVARTRPPSFSLLAMDKFIPRSLKGERRRARWEGIKESCKGEVMVSTEEHMALRRVRRRESAEEVQDLGGVGAPVAVVAQKYEGGDEERWAPKTELQVAP